MKKLIQLALVLCLTFAVALPCMAGPLDQIKAATTKILDILAKPDEEVSKDEKREMIREIVDEQFDWEEMSRRVLALYWKDRTDDEKKEFVALFGRLVEKTYGNRILNSAGGKVSYVSEAIEGDYAVVKVNITTSANVETCVDYKLHKKDGKWLIYDVYIQGVSLVNNYRSQFKSLILKHGYKKAVEMLQKKVS